MVTILNTSLSHECVCVELDIFLYSGLVNMLDFFSVTQRNKNFSSVLKTRLFTFLSSSGYLLQGIIFC